MTDYLIQAPCAYTDPTGVVVHHRIPGAIVALAADTAAALGAAVKPLRTPQPDHHDTAAACPGSDNSETPRPRGKRRNDPPAATVTVDGIDQGPPQHGEHPDDAHPGSRTAGNLTESGAADG